MWFILDFRSSFYFFTFFTFVGFLPDYEIGIEMNLDDDESFCHSRSTRLSVYQDLNQDEIEGQCTLILDFFERKKSCHLKKNERIKPQRKVTSSQHHTPLPAFQKGWYNPNVYAV